MTPTPADQAARDRITEHGLGETLFVEAGAGSGKTTQLVTRIVNLVLEHEVPLSSVAAITFTEAAASELRSRVRARFEAEERDGSPERAERARRALVDADAAAISTVHGFANRILAEHPLAAGLPPRSRVLDEVASRVQMEDRWAAFVEGLHHDAQTDPVTEGLLVRASTLGVELEPRYPGQVTLKTLALAFAQNWDRLEPFRTRAPRPLPDLDWTPLLAAIDAVVGFGIEARCRDHDDRLLVQLRDTTVPAMVAVRDATDGEQRLQLARTVWKATNGRAECWPEGGKAKIVELVGAAEGARQELVARASHDLLTELIARVARNELDAAEARREAGTLEFHDLLVLARSLLRTDAGARAHLGTAYRHLLLDEFQDTDPIQIELAVLIAGSVAGRPDDDPAGAEDPPGWATVDVDPGRLFFVGDPKQSIYRFRRADIGLFLQAMRRFGGDDEAALVRLTTNFRSVAPILEFANELFAELMVEEGDSQPRFEPLTASRASSPAGDHRPVLLGGPHPDPKVKADALREAEAADVAEAAAAVRDDPAAWPVWDHAKGGWRDPTLRDVTILVPTRTSVPYLRRALDARGIPYRLATGTLVYDSQEIRDVLSVLRAVDDPTDELSLVAALRSPLLACSDVDLFTFRRSGGRWRFTSTPPADLPVDHPVAVAFERLGSLREERWWRSPSAMVDRVLRSCSAPLLAYGDTRPTEVWNRLRFLLDQARLFEQSVGGGLREFLRWTELQSAEGSRVHEPILAETDEDAVRVMTVHSAKGLEFPITILSGATTVARPPRGLGLVWDADGLPALRWAKGVATQGHDVLADLEEEMSAHEKLRLLYVALTRACDHLVVSCHHKEGGQPSWSASVYRTMVDRPHRWRRLEATVGPPRQLELLPDPTTAPAPTAAPIVQADVGVAVDEESRDRWRAERAAVLRAQWTRRVMSATGVAQAAGAGSGAADGAVATTGADLTEPDEEPTDDRFDVDSDEPGAAPRRRGRVGNAIGSATHATLQLLDLGRPTEVEAQAARQCDVESIPEHAATVTRLVRSALASDAVRLAAAHPHHKELYVISPVGDGADPPVVEGYVDLLIDTPDGLVVVDYKTDTVADDEAVDAKVAAYRLQGAAYAAALERVTGRPVVECRFVFCRPSGAVERSLADLPAAMAEVRAVVGAGGVSTGVEPPA